MAKPIDRGSTPALPAHTSKERGVLWAERKSAKFANYPLARRLDLLDALKADAAIDTEDGIRFTLHSASELRRAREQSDADRQIKDWISTFRDGEVFYDIGANIGRFSLLAGIAHRGCVPVYAFEPSYSSYEALVRNVIANGLASTVVPVPLAFYSETGLYPFHYRRLDAGTAKHGIDIPLDTKSRELFEPVVSQPVLTMSVDDFVAHFAAPPPVHVKIDIDGHEGKVLDGARDTLARSIRSLCVEVIQASPSDTRPADLRRRMEQIGFDLRQVINQHQNGYPYGFDCLFVRR